MKATGGNWDRTDSPVYFLAGNTSRLEDVVGLYPFLLIAVNEAPASHLARWLDKGSALFLDSGVYWLATQHANAHGLTMDQALGLAPDEVDGFDALFDSYVQLATEFGDRLWGYIEIDQGGKENKRKTRARLESLGLRPIPVYHPLNDGWDYFDELASQYDRICFGNVVKADKETRCHLIATAYERRRKYPNLWLHLLGVTPNERLMAWPSSSSDSSTWLQSIRWPHPPGVRAAGKSIGKLDTGFQYRLGSSKHDDDGAARATRLSGLNSYSDMTNWRRLVADYRDVLKVDL